MNLTVGCKREQTACEGGGNAKEKYSGYVVDVVGNRIFKGEITVSDGKIAAVEEKDNVDDCYIAPGLVDAHIHIESSMLLPGDFAREAVRHGTVAAVSDPHEIANVMGVQGVRFMIDNSRKTPFKFCFGAPSCVPATVFETAGAGLGVQEVAELLAMPEVGYLSEMMNYPGVINGDPSALQKIALARQAGKPVDGHAPGLAGSGLQQYVAAGITTDHECFTLEEAREKLALGMKILIREGSAAKNFGALHPLVQSHPDQVMFCSDDLHPDDLVRGHINLTVKKALGEGYSLLSVLRLCTYNPVRHYNLPAGLLQVGDDADFMIFDNPGDFNILKVFIKGEPVACRGETMLESVKETPLNTFAASRITASDIEIPAQSARIKVIDIIPGEIVTGSAVLPANIVNGKVESDITNDVLKIVNLNRYRPAKPAVAFIRHSGLKKGAIASSVMHDSHNIICIGANDDDIVAAVNAIIDAKGGISASMDGITSVLPLPFGGIMDNRDASLVAKDYGQLDAQAKAMGTSLAAPYMTLSFMGLLVIPELKLSDKGLFDGIKFEFTDLFVFQDS